MKQAFRTYTNAKGSDLLDTLYDCQGHAFAPAGMDPFIFPALGTGWYAVHIPEGGGEWFMERFPTKAQAVLYLTTDIPVDEIRRDYAPEPVSRTPNIDAIDVEHSPERVLGGRNVYRVVLHETLVDNIEVIAASRREAEDAVNRALDDGRDIGLSFDESLGVEVADTEKVPESYEHDAGYMRCVAWQVAPDGALQEINQ